MRACPYHSGLCAYHAGDPARCDRCHASWPVILRTETQDEHAAWHDARDRKREGRRALHRAAAERAAQNTLNSARKGGQEARAAVPVTPGTPHPLNGPQPRDSA
jgi:hypothetical protein